MRPAKKLELKRKRQWRIRKKVTGTAERPRMAVCFTCQHIHVQFVDDVRGATLAAVSTRPKGKVPSKSCANQENAKRLGAQAAEAAKARGISTVVFDRGGSRYHGKVKALADAAREAGLKF
jgi:large subunit ribosomal protein L18